MASHWRLVSNLSSFWTKSSVYWSFCRSNPTM